MCSERGQFRKDSGILARSNGGRVGLERCQAEARKHVRLFGHVVVVKSEKATVYEPGE